MPRSRVCGHIAIILANMYASAHKVSHSADSCVVGSVARSRIYKDQVLIIFLTIASANKINNCNINQYILK